MKKKILLLGGSAQQVIAIETAKKLGYETVLCDYLPDNPGQYHADHFHLVSTTDKEAILQVAKRENIDGVIAYASDPAAPTAAYVAEQMNLPTNPYRSVEILCNKDRFREFLTENGFNAPVAKGYTSIEDAMDDIGCYRFPVIVKPVDSSGSKGATVLHAKEGLREAVAFAFSFSRGKRIIIEEFIEKKHPYLIGGDIFVLDGKVTLWGLMNCHRDDRVNSLVPVGKSYPPVLESDDLDNVKKVLQDMVNALHITSGAMNVELIVDKNGKVWPIDVGPRCGGNMIPDLLGFIFNVDVVEMSILAAMGENVVPLFHDAHAYYATHNLHSDKNGTFKDVCFTDELEQYIIRKCIYKKSGDEIEFFDNASKALGIVFFEFDTLETMNRMLENINEHICIELQ